MKLNKLTKKDLALIAEAEAMNESGAWQFKLVDEQTVGELARELTNADDTPFEPFATPDPLLQEVVADEYLAGIVERTEVTSEVIDPLLAEVQADEIEREAVAELEALEADDEAPLGETVDAVCEPEASEDAQLSFDEIVSTIGVQERLHATVAMSKALDERAAFELANGNDNIQKTIKKAREQLSLPSAGAILLACGVDEAFVNRSVHDGKRYNVYAFGKLADAVKALSDGAITNKINYAVMRSMFNARRAGVPFSIETAKAAASDKIRVSDAAVKAILIRHTVSATTAPTQASSTMQAMETLGLVTRSGHKNPVFTFTDHPAVSKLETLLAA